MREGAVDDGVRTDVEQLQIDVTQQLLELQKALRMPQGDVQNFVGHQTGLLRERHAIESCAVI